MKKGRTPKEFRVQFPDIKPSYTGQNGYKAFYDIFVPEVYKIGREDDDDFSEYELVDAIAYSMGYFGGSSKGCRKFESGWIYSIETHKD
jgi:hypothetical protein